MSKTPNRPPLYNIWAGIKKRCFCTTNLNYQKYGATGISMCADWARSFRCFESYVHAIIGARPSPKHSIDRYPNPHGNYEPGNIRWATAAQQANNTRRFQRDPIPAEPFVDLYLSGLSQVEVAQQIGMSTTSVKNRLRQMSAPLVEHRDFCVNPKVGELNAKAKLKSHQIPCIMSMRGVKGARTLAAELGVSRSAIQFIHQGKNWKCVQFSRVLTDSNAAAPLGRE